MLCTSIIVTTIRIRRYENATNRIGTTRTFWGRVRSSLVCICYYHHHHVCIVLYCILVCLFSYHRSPPLYYNHRHQQNTNDMYYYYYHAIFVYVWYGSRSHLFCKNSNNNKQDCGCGCCGGCMIPEGSHRYKEYSYNYPINCGTDPIQSSHLIVLCRMIMIVPSGRDTTS